MSKKNWVKFKRGLITDPKHRQAMGESVWVFFYMLDRTNYETGIIEDWKDEGAAEEMEMPTRTLREQRRKLESAKYITCEQTQHGQRIIIHKWVNPRSYSGEVMNIQGDALMEPSPPVKGDKKTEPSKIQGYTQGDALMEPVSIISNHVVIVPKGTSAQSRAGTVCPVCFKPCRIGASSEGAIAICDTDGYQPLTAPETEKARKRKKAAPVVRLPNAGCALIFAEAYANAYRFAYVPDAGDLAQYKKMRASYNGEVTEETWRQAVVNFFQTPRDSHRLKELCVKFPEFHKSAFDKYNRPVLVVTMTPRRQEIVT